MRAYVFIDKKVYNKNKKLKDKFIDQQDEMKLLLKGILTSLNMWKYMWNL
jgi:hypothetical protein